MEENRNYAKECGIRCRQIRMSKGMSQQALADKINVTAAAISKWEKEGIANIDQIMRISNALGQDITADQFDQDGAISEVGKEILRILIKKNGYVDFSYLENNMYGMKGDRVSNELFKLERIGAVIREQYTDYLHKERDSVFITAKGVIAFKNSIGKDFKILGVTTMDERLNDGATSFQDLIDRDVTTGVLMALGEYPFGFRCDYLRYLYINFFQPITNKDHRIWFQHPQIRAELCGESAYIDILRRMAQKATRNDIEGHIAWVIRGEDNDIDMGPDDRFWLPQIAAGLDEKNWEAIKYFCKEIGSMPSVYNICYTEEDWLKQSKDVDVKNALKELKELDKECEQILQEDHTLICEILRENEETFFGSMKEEIQKKPDLWFSYEEIKNYIEENILPAETENEKALDSAIHRIWDADEQTMNYYYEFPRSWEANGLAQLVRDRVGVPKR